MRKNFFWLPIAVILTIPAFGQRGKVEYFQQEVNYSIKVTLDDKNNILRGFEEIQYINNAPHSLSYLYFHLWPNAYRNRKTALAKQLFENGETDFYFANPNDEYGYIDSLQFLINKDTVRWEYDSLHRDICKIYLKDLLLPGDTITISTPFLVKIPGSFSRLGHVEQSYQITQWYPKPAIYDRGGWHQIPYLDQGEFYSEFGTYDVTITLPKNYVVAATGDLYNCPEEEKWLETKAKITRKLLDENNVDKLGRIKGEFTDEFQASSSELKTIRYKQKNVHDFAWFADKRFYVLRGEYNLPKSGRNVTLWSFFTFGNSRYWAKSIQYLHDALKYYSQWNGEYPYNIVSAVDGTISAGGGMEYPTVTVIGDVGSDISLETVLVHEVGHNWFYGILGSNERMHPWLDEGLNSFNELRYLETKYPELSLIGSIAPNATGLKSKFGLENQMHKSQYELSYLLNARRNFDQPIELPSEEYTPTNYGGIVYSKTAIYFDYLRAYLGEKVFDKCMHAYYEKYKFKHPQPDDLRDVFMEIAKKDLRWFFDGLLKDNSVIDYKIKRKKRIDRNSSSTYMWMKYEESLVIENKTGNIVPFCIQGIRGDTVAAEVWYEGHKGKQTVYFPNGPYEYFKIDFRERIPEINRRNNRLNEKGILKTIEPFRFQFLGSIEDPKKTTLYYTPVLGYNSYDGFQLGFAAYNNLFPPRRFEWQIMPAYGFSSGQPVGMASINWRSHFRKNNLLNQINTGVAISSYSSSNDQLEYVKLYSRFVKVSPYVNFLIQKKKARSPHNHLITLRSHLINEFSSVNYSGILSETPTVNNDSMVYYNDLEYKYNHEHTLYPWRGKFLARQAEQFLQLSIDISTDVTLNKKGKTMHLRFFTGKFLSNSTGLARYNWRMDGQRGYHDYTYEGTFGGRMESTGLWNQQFVNNHGGFKTPTANGQSNDWISSFNIISDLPIPIIKLFADAGLSGDSNGNTFFLYDAGLNISVGRGILNVYFPLVYSSAIRDEYNINNVTFGKRIRFTIDLKKVNPFELIRNIRP